jgi:hypothetical protein
VNDNGSELPASKQLRPLPYGLWDDEDDKDGGDGGDRWLPVFRDMVTAFEVRKAAVAAAAAEKKRKKSAGARQGKKRRTLT